MGSSESTKSSKSTKTTESNSFTWKEPEGGLIEILKPSRVKLGQSYQCTYACCVATNEPITSSNKQPREWKILVHQLMSTTEEQNTYLGFFDTEPDKGSVGDHSCLGPAAYSGSKDSKPVKHQYSAIIPASKIYIGDVFTFRVNFATKKVILLHNGKKPSKYTFPDITSEWTFMGDRIYPAVSKNYGVTVYQILTKNEDVTSLISELKQISLSDHNYRLGVLNAKYDSEQKEGFGNKFSDNHCLDDIQLLFIKGSYKIEAPNSITWTIKQEHSTYRIDWGLRGSFCGLGVGRRRFTTTDVETRKSKIKVQFHFGFIFNGNDYTLTEPEFGTEHKDRHWMSLELCHTDRIYVSLCGSKTAACNSLSEVWQVKGERESKDYKYYRLNPGFCRTSVQSIAGVINREKRRTYRLCYDENTNWRHMKDLSMYTNCMLFVIRLCKICNMQIPEWSEIIQMFDVWEDSEKFANSWSHFKKYAIP